MERFPLAKSKDFLHEQKKDVDNIRHPGGRGFACLEMDGPNSQ
jgi:hypothetical protein